MALQLLEPLPRSYSHSFVGVLRRQTENQSQVFGCQILDNSASGQKTTFLVVLADPPLNTV